MTTFSSAAYSQAKMIKANGEILDEQIAQSVSVHPTDSLALVTFYHSMNGDTWRDNTGWLVDMVPFWNGVHTISEIEVSPGVFEWRVTRLNFFQDDNNMTQCGFLPPELGDLVYMFRFEIARESVCGSVPEELITLPLLTYFRVRANYLTGEIPWDAIGNSVIQNLSLEQNNWTGPVMTAAVANNHHLQNIVLDEADMLTGSLPPEILQLPNLVRLGLDALTRIEGPLPDFSQSASPNFARLEVQYANFDPGPFPAWLRDLGGDQGLAILAIQQTNMTGPIPDWLPELTRVTELKVGGTEMGMDMADFPDLSLMPNLVNLRIWGGNFTGELPIWFRDLTSLTRLWIAYTDIGGDLPGFLAELTSLNLLKLRDNQFTGGIPPQFAALTGLVDLVLENNNLEIGPIPDFIGNNMTGLNKLYLGGSGVTGEIPSSLQNAEGLTLIRLQNNPGLTGTIPGWVWDRDMLGLDISYTGIDVGGEFPSELQNKTRIYKLGLAGLGISGPIPHWLGELDFFRTDGTREHFPYLSLADNNITGEIPANFASFWALDSLNLANNQLEGSIEMLQYVGRVTGSIFEEPMLLSALDISGNPGLTGEIPASFMDGTRLRVFRFDDTGLCLPPGFAEWLETHEERATTAYSNRTMHYSSVTDPSTVEACDVVSIRNETAYRFHLHQNYPNPFNPSSTIRYEIAEDVNVRLTVYNVLGQRIAVLVNEPKTAGSHQVQFDARNLASGQYIYRLEAGDRVMNQTMTLIK